ncbi:uncharacterized protein LOC141639537 [Silene latifolia]|uniref:uncharacterized protein LOC141639537 n=1 Tax=Silene latifolia TaxID=37657 RepID=UPI003D782A68
MTAFKNSQNRFTPLRSTTKSSLNSAKASVVQSPTNGGPKGGNFPGHSPSDTGRTRAMNDIQVIPVLNLSEGETVLTDSWYVRHGGKDIPVMEPILEEEDTSELLQFTTEDIKPEVEFWNHSVICYILGANPPWDIVENYVYNVWEQFGIDKVSFLDNGVFIVKFSKKIGKDALLRSGYYMFDNKPVISKPWVPDMELVKEKVAVVPVWIKLYGIPLKFWGNCLSKIAGLVGKFVKMDGDTQDKIRLSYARVMVELPMDQELTEKVKFLDESGNLVTVKVEYEWRPISCSSCNGIGHNSAQCRKPDKRRPKAPSVKAPPKPQKFGGHCKRHKKNQKMQDGIVGVRLSGKFSPYTFVDALKSNSAIQGGVLWLGDFNTVLSPVERLGGSTSDAEMEHFQDCVSICCMEDIDATGALFTWSNKQAPVDRVYSRLDRAMGNQEWLDLFGDSVAHFHPEGLFDHCPCTIMDRNFEIHGRKSFKYFIIWGAAPTFKALVSDSWSMSYQGTKMFGIIKKLNALKPILKALNKECLSDIENNTNIASIALETIQKAHIENPGDATLLQQELDLPMILRISFFARDSFLIQKAKVQWSLEGDLNTSYFHHSIKKRVMMNKVFQIEDKDGVMCTDGAAIQNAFLVYYQELLGTHNTTVDVNINVVRQGQCCTQAHWFLMNSLVIVEEVKKCLFSIPANKSPGPDGYSSQFYRDAWDIINATVITLIPKIDRPVSVKHYRPISYWCFFKGRSILENILICQDLIRQYSRGKASPRCLFKLDLQKAYDLIEWTFVDQMLEALHFPEKFRRMIMLCISTPTYTLNLNGAQFGYFPGRRGLRQGDPISPLIFCICMEYLSRIMEFATRKWYFRYHPICKSLKLTHLLFADDLLMFSKGDVQSIMLILGVLATFSGSSGLKVNASKSEVVYNGVPDSLKLDIAQVSGFQEGKLPFKYLGIPIQPGRLTKADCNVLLEKIVSKIRGIGARKLSYAGRLVLIKSVLNTLHNYWASIFLIPKGVIKRIESICRNFLWCGGSDYNRAPLVAWQDVCCSKKEGGLGIKEAGVCNIASVGKLVNWIYTKADRLWVLWIDHVYMKGADWETYHPPPVSNWNWRNICKIKDRLAGGYQGNCWVASTGGYSISSGYQWLQAIHPPVPWNALNTRSKLYKLGLSSTATCVICEMGEETHDHLFWDCVYASKIIAGLETWLQLKLNDQSGSYSKLQQRVCRVVKSAVLYAIWLERNSARLDLSICRPERLLQQVLVGAFGPGKMTDLFRSFALSWNHVDILCVVSPDIVDFRILRVPLRGIPRWIVLMREVFMMLKACFRVINLSLVILAIGIGILETGFLSLGWVQSGPNRL